MIITALSVGSGVADELKIKFYEDAQKRFGDKIPIEASAIREDGKVRIIVKNISVDYITITKEPQGWWINYLSDGKWRKDSASTNLADMDQLDHVLLRPFKDEKSYNTMKIVFEIPSYHEDDSMAEIKLNLGAYFPSLRDYVKFSIVAKLTLETRGGEQAVPSDGHKPSNSAPSSATTAPADAH